LLPPARFGQLHLIECISCTIDQQSRNIRDITGIDITLVASNRGTERCKHRRRSLQISPLPLNRIQHSSFKDVLLRPSTSTLARALLSPLRLSPSLRTHDRPPIKVGCGSRIAGVTARRCGACDVLRDFGQPRGVTRFFSD
jgi:hypothetical protein